jgi:glycerol-3-phosphate cytidylyltransferase
VTRVITYGTFDLFHQGHYNIIKRAKELGDYLIIGVTGESYDIERGKLNVQDSLMKRIENVRSTGLADEIIVEEFMGQKIRDIQKYNVDILVVGSDWIGKFDYLKKYCDVVYLERTKNISSTQLREDTVKIYKIGVMTDSMDDGGVVLESKFVSGLHVETVYAEDRKLASDFCNTYELNGFAETPAALRDTSDIIYIKTAIGKRYEFICDALRNGKHVIASYPFAEESQTQAALYALARENNVLITPDIPLAYMRAFQQLIWHMSGGLIGDIISVECSAFYEDDRLYALALPLFVFSKLLGTDPVEASYYGADDAENGIVYDRLSVQYGNSFTSAVVGTSKWISNRMSVVGTKGRIDIPEDWRLMGYFKADIDGEAHTKRYSFNIDGNGMRYLLQETLITIRDGILDSVRFTPDEAAWVAKLLDGIRAPGRS